MQVNLVIRSLRSKFKKNASSVEDVSDYYNKLYANKNKRMHKTEDYFFILTATTTIKVKWIYS